MEGFILAAGLGTRLRPITDSRPKALVEVGGTPLLELAIRKLESTGVTHIVVNIHHLGQQIIDFLSSRQWSSHIDISDERSLLLDTGGSLKAAAHLFSGAEPIVVHNVDILSHIDLRRAEAYHTAHRHLVTLCASQRPTARPLLFQPDGQLIGRFDPAAPQPGIPLAFSGISIVSPALFPLLPPTPPPYPIIPCYIQLAKQHPIRCYEHSAEGWLDVGKPETLKQANLWTLSSDK